MSGELKRCLECGLKKASVYKVVKSMQYWRCAFCSAEWSDRAGSGK